MSAAAAVLGNMKFARDDANRASFVAVLDEERDTRILAEVIARFVDASAGRQCRAVVVELRPRHFTEAASHFLSVTTPVAWPTDEHDTD